MMKQSILTITILLAFSTRGLAAGPVVSPLRAVSPPALARSAEFTFDVGGNHGNPYDPDEIKVDASVTGPDGRSWNVPAFWMEPCTMQVSSAATRFAGLTFVQFYISAAAFPRGKPVSFAICSIALSDSGSGRQRAFSELMRPEAWTCRKGATVVKGPERNGEPALVVTIVPDGQGHPGIHLAPTGEFGDWSAYDTLQLQVKPLSGLAGESVSLEIRKDKTKHSFRLLEAGPRNTNWQERVWRYDRRTPVVSWAPPGKGEWRLRIAAPVAGDYEVALTARDRQGTTAAPSRSFHLARTTEDGFIRVAPECPRYLRYDSGEPFFSVGTNLLVFKDDFAEYAYYMDRFTNVGVNLFRVWLNGPCLGFEKEGVTHYGPRECAVLDTLLNHADQRKAAVMLCQLDFREVSEKKNNPHGGWHLNPYNTLCAGADEFFTNVAAKQAFRKRLRYLVARWSASPAVHSWEFFNEVNITDAWRRADGAAGVRAWHGEMAAYVRRIDPYEHLLTTSLSNRDDDPIWNTPLIELVQPHCYQTAAVDFASLIRSPCRELSHHGKPLFPGEFGLMTIKYEDVVEGGVSIHNGMWASVMSGCAGTGMPWWWEWIDRHDTYHHFAGVAEFVRDVRWHEQAFLPIPEEKLNVSVPRTAESGLGSVRLELERHTWDATALYNHPVRITVGRDGFMEPARALSGRLHGVRNHRDCHNPKTFLTDWPEPGRFVVSVGTVSGYGGANLRITVDGEERLFQDFVDEDEALENVMRRYRGDYGVDVPPGKHEIGIENTGNDWITLDQIRLENYGTQAPGLDAMGLRGTDTFLLWLRNRDYTWFGARDKEPCRQLQGAQVSIRGVPRGSYAVRFYDPQTATWLGEQKQRTGLGSLELELPDTRHDLAIAIRRHAGE